MEENPKMTIKFSIRHHYKNVPIEISVEAPDLAELDSQLLDAIRWLRDSRHLIDTMYEQTVKLTEKKEKPWTLTGSYP